ncbi:MAG: hypothetical protein DMG07_07765 [Acidobacteria bacterium]|nr:MAG: hypothetical protein DMG07_07765 [Acidobacteriota bacterium]
MDDLECSPKGDILRLKRQLISDVLHGCDTVVIYWTSRTRGHELLEVAMQYAPVVVRTRKSTCRPEGIRNSTKT